MNLNLLRSIGLVAFACAVAIPSASAQFVLAPEPPDPPFFAVGAAAFTGGSFLGVGVAEITSERARELKLREEHGVEITRVEDDSPAAKAGLKSGDVVLEYNGQRVEGMEQFGRLVRETPAGREVKLLISRNGANQTIQAAVGARKGNVLLNRGGDFHFEMPEFQMPDIPRVFSTWSNSMLGVEAESLGKQLADYFGVKDGVLVRSVAKGSAAETAGIKAGDVITKVDQALVTSPNDLSSAVRSARSKKPFTVQLMRDHREMSVTVNVDEDRSGSETFPRTKIVRGRTVKM
jgi:serine protease Do